MCDMKKKYFFFENQGPPRRARKKKFSGVAATFFKKAKRRAPRALLLAFLKKALTGNPDFFHAGSADKRPQNGPWPIFRQKSTVGKK